MKDPHRFFPFESSRCCEYNEEREDGYIFVDRNQLFFMCITTRHVQPDLSADLCNPLFRTMGQGREYMESSCIRNLPQNSLIPMQFSNFN